MMKEVKQQLRGSICPAIIPLKLSREAYYETMSNLINWQIESESHGVSITGTSGGSNFLTLEERVNVMPAPVKVTNGSSVRGIAN